MNDVSTKQTKKEQTDRRQKWEWGMREKSGSKEDLNLFLLSVYMTRFLNLNMKQWNHIHIKPLK